MGNNEQRVDLPPPPPFPSSVRLATLDDLPRVAFVAAAGFYNSQFTAYQRPRFTQYPTDVLADYREQCLRSIVDPSQILLVAEADYDDHEGDAVTQSLKGADVQAGFQGQRVRPTGKVVVGYAGISLRYDGKRIGTFQTCELNLEDLRPDPENLHRDMGTKEGLGIWLKVESEMHEVFEGKLGLTRMAVHPAYLRRGHARKLMQWSVDLADVDEVQAYVATTNPDIYQPMGFEEVATRECQGYQEHSDPRLVWFGVRQSQHHE